MDPDPNNSADPEVMFVNYRTGNLFLICFLAVFQSLIRPKAGFFFGKSSIPNLDFLQSLVKLLRRSKSFAESLKPKGLKSLSDQNRTSSATLV